jgi:50S ribosomal protein L16 3-hydroxylase
LSGFLGFAAEHCHPLARYSDPDHPIQFHPGEITPKAMDKIKTVIRQTLMDDKMIEEWFGQFVTEPRRGYYALQPDEPLSGDEILARLQNDQALHRVPGTAFAFYREGSGDASLYAGGLVFLFPAPIADAVPVLCDAVEITARNLASFLESETFVELLCELVNEGYFVWNASNET